MEENSNKNIALQIAFPKSSEDHRLQLISINGAIFAILYAPLESLGPIRLYCEEWSLVLLAPIKSKSDVLISAINVICLSEILAEEGYVNIQASNRLITFADLVKSSQKVSSIGLNGSFGFDDDPGAFLHFYRLFEGIVSELQSREDALISEVQQDFIKGLCTLADKVERPKTLDLSKVLSFWSVHS